MKNGFDRIMSFRRLFEILILAVGLNFTCVLADPPDAPIAPDSLVQVLGKGFDVSWVQFKKNMESYNVQMVRDIARAGFRHIRLRTNRNADDALFGIMDRTVNDCLNNGLIPIIAYGAADAEENADSTHRDSVVAWWRKVAEHYRDYSHRLVFDIFIELSGELKYDYEKVNNWYKLIVPAIRQTNPTRIVILSPVHLSDPNYLSQMEIPDAAFPYAMAEWHFYAGGPSKTNAKKLWTTGTPEERKLVTDKIQTALDWQKQTGVPTWVGAWMPGNYNKGNDYTVPEQVVFASFMVRELEKAGIPWAVNAIHHFYDANTNQWIQNKLPVRDAMLDPRKIALYEQAGYGGKITRLAIGAYDQDFLQRNGLLNRVGSLMVPDQMQVTFYESSGFSGESRTFSRTDSALAEANGTFNFASLKVDTTLPTGIFERKTQGLNLQPFLQGFPNPFNGTLRIAFRLQHSGRVRLNVYDISGRFIASLLQKDLPAGRHRVLWQGRDRFGRPVASGIYFARLKTERFDKSIKLLMLR